MKKRCLALVLTVLFCSEAMSQQMFDKEEITLEKKSLLVEVAKTPEQRNQGLMFRRELKKNEGMLFVFDSESPQSFWMKNTFIPLSIGFFDKQGRLVAVKDMEPGAGRPDEELPSYSSDLPALMALEVPRGWFKENKIKTGARLIRKIKAK